MTQSTEARRSASRAKYTLNELKQIGCNLEYSRLAQVAARFERTPAAIQERLRKEGQGLFANDGFVSAAQLSRETGIPCETILKMLKDGTLGLEAYKAGRVWRINWRGQDLTEQWDQATPGKLIKEVTAREKGRITCINCGNRLVEADVCCSKGCSREFQGELRIKHFTGEFSHGYGFPPHLRPKFQEWLSELGLIKQSPKAESIKAKRKVKLRARIKLGDKETALAEEMIALPGFIIPFPHLKEVHGGSDETVKRCLYRLRDKLLSPSDLFNFKWVGWGLGIAGCDLTGYQITLLRQLWQREGIYTSASRLVECMQVQGSKGDSLDNVQGAIYLLRDKLESCGYAIMSGNRWNPHPHGRAMYSLQKQR